MTQNVDKICTLLDKLTLDALTLMEQEIQAKLELEKCMAGGEINLVKTRYITGQTSVSQLQLPSEESPEFEANAVVHPHKDDKLFGRISYDLEVKRKSKEAGDKPEESGESNKHKNGESNKHKKEESNKHNNEESSNYENENSSYQDPIKWFGYLVPQSLHQAQNKFRQALVWVVKSVNIQTQLDETCAHIEKLHSIKDKLVRAEQ